MERVKEASVLVENGWMRKECDEGSVKENQWK